MTSDRIRNHPASQASKSIDGKPGALSAVGDLLSRSHKTSLKCWLGFADVVQQPGNAQ
jgi:hypothetical protein